MYSYALYYESEGYWFCIFFFLRFDVFGDVAFVVTTSIRISISEPHLLFDTNFVEGKLGYGLLCFSRERIKSEYYFIRIEELHCTSRHEASIAKDAETSPEIVGRFDGPTFGVQNVRGLFNLYFVYLLFSKITFETNGGRRKPTEINRHCDNIPTINSYQYLYT